MIELGAAGATVYVTGRNGQEPYAFAEQLGDLPDDLVIALTGSTLSVGGTPRVAGTFGLGVWIEDQAGATLAESIPLRVLDDPSIDPTTLLGAVVGAASLSPDQATTSTAPATMTGRSISAT